MRAVRIGVLAPLTRPGWAEAGRHLLAGVELAARDAGVPLELVVRDTAADPAKAEAAVDELADLGVAALAGEYHSVVARAAAARADALGLPFLCSSAVLDTLTEQPSDWVARIAPAQSRGWRVYADHLLGAGHRRIAVAAQPSVYWAAGTAILRAHLAAHGGDVIELDSKGPGTLVPGVGGIGRVRDELGGSGAAGPGRVHDQLAGSGPAGGPGRVGDEFGGSGAAGGPGRVCDELAGSGAAVLLLLVGTPEPAVSIVRSVRGDRRLADVLIGAPAGQPEFAGWAEALGDAGAGIPFLRYLPDQLTPLGERVAKALYEQLGGTPSFVAFEGYDTIAVLAEVLRDHGTGRADIAAAWPHVTVEGTRGRIQFSRVPGIGVQQWAWPPIQVADRDPAAPGRFRVLHTG